MFRYITPLLLGILSVATINAQQAGVQQDESPTDVTITARLERLDRQTAKLIVTGKIADGLHIYAQSQPKPFLATKITLADSSTGITSVSDFTSDQDPIVIQHPQLGVELHEYEDTVRWSAEIELAEPGQAVSVAGTVFAQACEAERCFAPQTYSFNTQLEADSLDSIHTAMLKPMDNSDSAAAAATFSLSQLQVESAAHSRSAWEVIPLAFVAGFLLNFMPCVLPVVGLKLLSFVQQAKSDRKRILMMNVAYTAGLLSVMLILATLAVFAGFGWGEQFSSAGFTITLSAIVFAFGLSFLGVWEIPLPGFIGAGGQTKQEGYAGAFSKGILSTLLATPCSGPFLGAALAWAVTQPSYLTYSVFTAVGLGMASPYLVVGLFPSTIRFLPKPGNWMVTFKQVMGFVMLITVVYLLSFIPVALVVPTVLLLLGIGMAVWIAARTPIYAPGVQQVKAWSIATAVIAVTAVVSFGWLHGVMQSRFERSAARWANSQSNEISVAIEAMPEKQGRHIAWQSYSPELLESVVRTGKPVFIDFTADWCLTCKANEASAVETQAVAKAIRDAGAIAIRADKTTPNPAVDDLLRKLGNSAASIPFYAVFPADDPGSPVTLDGVFTSPKPLVEALINASHQARTPAPQHLSVRSNR